MEFDAGQISPNTNKKYFAKNAALLQTGTVELQIRVNHL